MQRNILPFFNNSHNKVADEFHTYNEKGNKILRLSRIGICTAIRYVRENDIYYFSVNDVIESFNINTKYQDVQSIWNTIPQYIRQELLINAIEYNFDGRTEHDELFTYNPVHFLCYPYRDVLKLILSLPFEFQENALHMDLFMSYYESYFGFIKTMEKKSKWWYIDRHTIFLNVIGIILGVLTTFIILLLTHKICL
jgi:hypothetical protein